MKTITLEDYRKIRGACSVGKRLDKAEIDLAKAMINFAEASDLITELTGLELWHTDAMELPFFWLDSENRKNSVSYESRGEAIQKLMDENIEWED